MINEETLMKNRDGCMLSFLKFNEENISVKELRNKTEVGMTDEGRAEKINELMNRISFALKDATLAQGFEIICKRISELEKDNKISEEIIIGEQQEINDLKKENEKLKYKLEQLGKRDEILTNIIMDVFKLNVDLCPLCKSKGEHFS